MKKNYLRFNKLAFAFISIMILIIVAACAPVTSNSPITPHSLSQAVPPPASSPAPVPPSYTIMTASKAGIGDYLVDSKGMALYYFTKDSLNKSTATAAILGNWPVFNAATFIIPSSLQSTDFGTINRDDGAKQATYKGWPLYYFVKDQISGDTLGQGVNGVWYAVSPDKVSVASQPQPIPTPTPGYGGGGGGY
jgi:predicted lipoprotein with Yx(FWY)xxD motif